MKRRLPSESQAKQINVRCICCRLNIWKSHFINIVFPQPHPHMAVSSGLCSGGWRPPVCAFNVHSRPGAFQGGVQSPFGAHAGLWGKQGSWSLDTRQGWVWGASRQPFSVFPLDTQLSATPLLCAQLGQEFQEARPPSFQSSHAAEKYPRGPALAPLNRRVPENCPALRSP